MCEREGLIDITGSYVCPPNTGLGPGEALD